MVRAALGNQHITINLIAACARIDWSRDLFDTQKQLKTTYDYVASFNLEDRIKKLGLNPDRADVILPAIEIYMTVLKASGTNKITISGLGLKEGIVAELLEKHHQAVIRNFQGNQRFSVH